MDNTPTTFTRHWTQAQPIIAAFVRSLIPNRQDADDLLQDTAVTLLEEFASYDPDRPFFAWALGVAKNKALHKRRAQARSRLVFEPAIVDTMTELIEERSSHLENMAHALRQCLQQVSGRQREILQLRYGDALKPREICERTRLAPATVRSMLSHIRAALHKCISRKLALAE